MNNVTEVKLYESNKEEQLKNYFDGVCKGFSKEGQKELSSMFMYDEEGSRLVEACCHTKSYYIWRCEKELLEVHASGMLEVMGKTTKKFNIVDLGAGDGSKTKVILEKAMEKQYDFQYIPIDISYDSNVTLCKKMKDLTQKSMKMTVLTSTFEDGINWINQNKKDERNLYLFMGGTIGSWDEDGLVDLVKFYQNNLKKGDIMAVGFDQVKDPYVIQCAYSNDEGVQNALILNNLARINRELDGNFVLENFYPHSYYEPTQRYIYSTVISKVDQKVTIRDQEFFFGEGEVIRFHRSRKWLKKEADQLFAKGNFKRIAEFQDSKSYFCYLFFEKSE